MLKYLNNKNELALETNVKRLISIIGGSIMLLTLVIGICLMLVLPVFNIGLLISLGIVPVEAVLTFLTIKDIKVVTEYDDYEFEANPEVMRNRLEVVRSSGDNSYSYSYSYSGDDCYVDSFDDMIIDDIVYEELELDNVFDYVRRRKRYVGKYEKK